MNVLCKCVLVVAVFTLAAGTSARADYVVDNKVLSGKFWIAGAQTYATYQEAQRAANQMQAQGREVRIRQISPNRIVGPETQRQQSVEIWTVPVWHAAPGKNWTIYGTYFVYRYPNGATDNSEPLEVARALNRAGYYSRFDNTQATFVRMGTR